MKPCVRPWRGPMGAFPDQVQKPRWTPEPWYDALLRRRIPDTRHVMTPLRTLVVAAVIGLTLGRSAASSQPRPAEGAAAAERGNGTMGQFTGAGGDPVQGEKVYQQKCASCHDAPAGRTPARETLAN